MFSKRVTVASVLCLLHLTLQAGTSSIRRSVTSLRTQRSVDDVSYLGCLSSVPSMQMVLFLDHICVDCFNLYNEIEIYSYCRSRCYNSNFMDGCMEAVGSDAATISKAHTYRFYLNLI
ncbi:ion transport peptide [Eurytemora carolleeae]|uniref:ion transport peptide n=1 Tax=Eurytemora carolleeae TaxID=1294199 RepID=UPI000C77429F|nr:ion transport peptide [Eurytemora carolleeae]|eukprot:XP_023349668.1 ion transport peptide-like [Eurytemora affinis]